MGLRRHFKIILDMIKKYNEVIVTCHRKPKVKLVPLENNKERKEFLKSRPAFGMWKDNEKVKDVDLYIRTLRKRT